MIGVEQESKQLYIPEQKPSLIDPNEIHAYESRLIELVSETDQVDEEKFTEFTALMRELLGTTFTYNGDSFIEQTEPMLSRTGGRFYTFDIHHPIIDEHKDEPKYPGMHLTRPRKDGNGTITEKIQLTSLGFGLKMEIKDFAETSFFSRTSIMNERSIVLNPDSVVPITSAQVWLGCVDALNVYSGRVPPNETHKILT